jgi:hypothetical protein
VLLHTAFAIYLRKANCRIRCSNMAGRQQRPKPALFRASAGPPVTVCVLPVESNTTFQIDLDLLRQKGQMPSANRTTSVVEERMNAADDHHGADGGPSVVPRGRYLKMERSGLDLAVA